MLFALALMPGVASQARGIVMHPWGTYLYCGVLAAVAFIVLWQAENRPERTIVSIFTISAALLITVLEVFFLLDRMNTLFKGYMAVWMLSGIVTMSAGYFAYRALAGSGLKRTQKFFRVGAYVFVALLLIGTSVNVFAIVRLKRVPQRVYTFDGIAYLRAMNPDDAAVIDWFNKNVRGTPVVLEAQGDGYREFARISMHTGLPTVLGWEHHARQRGLSHESALERRKAIQAIYTHEDIQLTRDLLLQYGVDFVVIGKVERNHYRRLELAKFESHPELFTKVASFGDSHVFVTFFSKYNSVYGSGVRK